MVVRSIAPQRRARAAELHDARHSLTPVVDTLLCQWLASDRVPRALIGRNHQLLWANQAAQEFLASRRDLAIRNDALVATDPVQQAQLAGVIDAARSTPRTWEVLNSEGEHVIIRLRPLDDDSDVITVTFWRAERPGFANLMRVFDLTRSEHAVLLQLLNGKVAEAIADHHGVKLDTVRTQIRAIYAKLGVSSREGLFDKVMAYSDRQ